MQLSLQNFSSLVDTMAATVQGACSSLIDLAVGSVLRAVLEAAASVTLWMQYLLLQVLTMTRLATSVGDDADSWVQDFGMSRLPATAATGQVTFATFSPGTQGAAIANGVTVRTSDGSQTFYVTGGPYIRPVGVTSVVVQVMAAVGGTKGNVQSGVVSTLGTAVPGIDTVTNLNAFSGGTDAETDAALRLRFVTFINTRAQATEQALGYAIASVQQGLSYYIQENVMADGTPLPGHVQVIVDDGSGAPPSSLLATVAAAIDPVRPIGTSVSVAAPVLLAAGVTATVTVDGSVAASIVQDAVDAALVNYINGLGVGQVLRYSRLAGLCYDADASITNVQSLTVDGAASDLGGAAGSVVRAGAITILVVAA